MNSDSIERGDIFLHQKKILKNFSKAYYFGGLTIGVFCLPKNSEIVNGSQFISPTCEQAIIQFLTFSKMLQSPKPLIDAVFFRFAKLARLPTILCKRFEKSS
jgi:hypothetical protein